MTDKVSHEEVERVFETAPADILTRLPDNTETRSAKRNLKIAADYVHQAIEKSERTPSTACADHAVTCQGLGDPLDPRP